MLIVWSQGNSTFTMDSEGFIDSHEKSYVLNDASVKIAHPLEMMSNDLEEWLKYFTAHSLKQPFLQIWEPVINPADVRSDRYVDCKIPYYRYLGRDRIGITVTDSDFHNEITITFSDLNIEINRVDWGYKHQINPTDQFNIASVGVKEQYTRRANHQLAYLGHITALERVHNDDVTLADQFPCFTFAQINMFISEAEKVHAVNVLALLLNYKNQQFSQFDPMSDFTLNW